METREMGLYLNVVRKWWWVIALLVGVTVGTMLAIAFLTEIQYEATVTVQVSAPPPQEVPLYSEFGRQALNDGIQQTRSSLNEFLLEGDVPYRTLEALPETLMNDNELRERITIDLPDNSQLMRISVRAADPETAALLANTVVELGLQRYGELQAQPTANTREFIERELEVARAELDATEAALMQFQINNRMGTLNRVIEKQYDLLRSLNLEYDLARVNGDLVKAQAIEKISFEREAELQDLIGLSAEYNELADSVERARNNFNFLLDRKTEAQIKENQLLDLGSVQIITAARPPRRPVAAIGNNIIVLGAVVSFLAGVLLTFLLEYLEISGAFKGFKKHSEQPEVIAVPDGAS